MKQEADMAKGQQDMQNDAFKRELDARDQQFQHAMEAQKQSSEARHAEVMGLLNARAKYMTTQAQVAGAEQQHQQKMQQSAQSHAQDMVHKEEQGKLAIQQAKAMPKTPSKGGSKKP
jgi:hypothetical protein